MSYRFARITNYYPQYLKYFYSKNSDTRLKSYAEHYNLLINDSYEIASWYSQNLNNIGIEAYCVISNALDLQNTWRKENNLPSKITSSALLIEQLKTYKPTVIWIDDFSFVNPQWKYDLLKQIPSIKLIVGHICAPFNSELEEKFRLFNLMFTCIPCFKKQLEKLGIKTYLLYHGFEKSILDNIETNNPFTESDFLFSGSLYTGSGFHKSRIEYIESILKAGINMDLYCNLESWKKVIAKKTAYKTIRVLRKLHLEDMAEKVSVFRRNKNFGNTPIKHYSRKLIQSSHPPVFGYDMYKLLSKAKICFNMHGEIAEKCAGNIRLFEATGVGTCLVTDWKENIADLFEPDKEIVTYQSAEECIEKVKWLLNNPVEREKIAKAGQRRTLMEHTIENRVRTMNEIITKELNKINL